MVSTRWPRQRVAGGRWGEGRTGAPATACGVRAGGGWPPGAAGRNGPGARPVVVIGRAPGPDTVRP
ncbi:hypothetical protein SCATT_53080 [Streptantibioticus cattleyicolor NRRL 8057 = DSM 46488]|uniref:Uncharacterized protein n=1 Tax=Streptantibioticus cattleyicolor (strain ATCC 35852 / DSM 46488 / JCM 4925 / NBRC 14057 / NRRL 8057) TaxID=1003195 RepID=G8X3S3_STREN|nr:hypothetical protein SCATT_53080 [Streptantibioticus cattleyicolor NRRL 8057 = DSM 46488]